MAPQEPLKLDIEQEEYEGIAHIASPQAKPNRQIVVPRRRSGSKTLTRQGSILPRQSFRSNEVIIQGILLVRKVRILQYWKSKLVTLLPGRIRVCQDSGLLGLKELSYILTDTFEVSVHTCSDHPFAFRLDVNQNEHVMFAADSMKQMCDWIILINQQIKLVTRRQRARPINITQEMKLLLSCSESELKRKIRIAAFSQKMIPELWVHLLTNHKRNSEYMNQLCDTYIDNKTTQFPVPIEEISTFSHFVPDFGSHFDYQDHASQLKPGNKSAAFSILYHLASTGLVSYCPLLPDLVCIMLEEGLSEGETYVLTHRLVRDSLSRNKQTYFPMGIKHFHVFTKTFASLLSTKLPQLHKTIIHLKIDIAEVFGDMASRCFVSYFGQPNIVRTLHCIFSEGFKVFFRMGLGIFALHQHILKECSTKDDFLSKLHHLSKHSNAHHILESGFNLPLSRAQIIKLESKHESNRNRSNIHGGKHVIYLPIVNNYTSELIIAEDWYWLWSFLNERMRLTQPIRAFSTSEDGYLLKTLLEKTASDHVIILIKTMKQEIVGMFLPACEDCTDQRASANRNIVLFRLGLGHKNHAYYSHTSEKCPKLQRNSDGLVIYEKKHEALGIDEGLRYGTTSATNIFQNEELVSCETGRFQIENIEAWVLRDVN